MKKIFTFFLFVNLFVYGDSPNLIEDNNISRFPSVQWLQSDEYNLLCEQIYKSARSNIDQLDSNSSFTAMVEQKQKQIQNLPSAIVTDIDETIVSTLEYQKKLLKNGESFSAVSWNKYLELNTATPLSGSLDYFSYLSKKGITIIYLSNRTVISKDQTYRLLKKLGYPIINKNNLLLKGEKHGWTGDKSIRRAYIANKFRVLQIFGDHLTDFAESKEEAIANKNKFGTSWFLMPNPIYGTWLKK